MPRSRLAVLVCSVALTALAGCDPDAGTSSNEARASINASENDGARPLGHHPLPVVVAHLALDLDLQAGQAAEIKDVLEALRASHDKARVADQALRQAATDGVAEGLISREALAGQLADVFTAAAAAGEAETVALDALHTLLDEDQRIAVVEMLAEQRDAHEGDQRRPAPGARLRHLAEAIGLTDDQIVSLHDTLGAGQRPGKPPTRDGGVLADFPDEDFDASDLGMSDRQVEHTARRVEGFLALLIALSDVVDEDQRAALVEFLAQPPPGLPRGPQHRPNGGSNHGPPNAG